MKETILGGSGIRVSDYCLGAMNFGLANTDRADCVRIFHRAFEAGINFVDTAERYAAAA